MYWSEKEVKNLQKIISMSKDTKTENNKVCYLIYVQLRKRHPAPVPRPLPPATEQTQPQKCLARKKYRLHFSSLFPSASVYVVHRWHNHLQQLWVNSHIQLKCRVQEGQHINMERLLIDHTVESLERQLGLLCSIQGVNGEPSMSARFIAGR